jgi:replication factor A1
VPVCQCVQIKPLAAQSGTGNPERYRIVLSDIKNFVQSMLATGVFIPCQLFSVIYTDLRLGANHVIHEGKLKKGSFVRLKSYQANAVKGKRFDQFSGILQRDR